MQMEPRPHTRRSQTRLFDTAVEFFLSLDAEDVSIRVMWPYVTEERLRAGMFPIAYCGGDLLCMSTRDDTSGQIFYWFSEDQDDAQAEGDRPLYFVAPDLDAFLNTLSDGMGMVPGAALDHVWEDDSGRALTSQKQLQLIEATLGQAFPAG